MGLSASQGRLLLLTARRSDLEFRAQQISQKRLNLSQQLEQISIDYENATSDRQMKIALYSNEVDESGNKITRTSNLTYAALVSGTLASVSSAKSGIQGYGRTNNQPFSSTTPYRLMSVDGAIVVSDKSEIPGSVTSTNTKKSKTSATQTNLYQPSSQNAQGKTTKGDYYVLAAKDSKLAEYIKEKDPQDVELSEDKTCIRFKDGDNWAYYKIADGTVVEAANAPGEWTQEEGKACHIVNNEDSIPDSTTLEESTTTYSEPVKGADGVWTVKDANGDIVGRYIIDEQLKYGTTDSSGASDGPNYLQDCLRNGKYLIQKGMVDENTDEGYRWSNVAWDATANISDGYYTENDDAAKAKYDRLQTQIQAQDKKLELELDNIETQRNAVTTEIESVEKVIQEDIESTFNAFG